VIEESSVVAAAASASGFWARHGGFKARVCNFKKRGHIHFKWNGELEALMELMDKSKEAILKSVAEETMAMRQRGGGILDLRLIAKPEISPAYYQLEVDFNTQNAMGANFINTCLEKMALFLKKLIKRHFPASQMEIIMAILSNYTPECLVEVYTECPVKAFDDQFPGLSGAEFVNKFISAIHIAENDVSRAVTHNKGIFNGIDAVLLATGNDWRAVEAGAHAYASRRGKYASLSHASSSEGGFRHSLKLPLSVGTVGGLTRVHPLASTALEILKNPSAKELMMIVATIGLANNFAAIRSLVTSGIQSGHMKMHLNNILASLGSTPEQAEKAKLFFKDRSISVKEVKKFLGK
jgi:hydroxymethylglutaryl-CoA reductase